MGCAQAAINPASMGQTRKTQQQELASAGPAAAARLRGVPARRVIAFVRQGSFSHINAAVEQALAREFPEHAIESVDVAAGFAHRRFVRWLNYLHLWRQFGPDLLAGKRTLWDCYYHTAWLQRGIRNWLAQRLTPLRGALAFTFQTQSLFHAAQPGTPHFLYTDHTHLANRTYPDFDPGLLFGASWTALERAMYHDAAATFTMSRHVAKSVIEDYACPADRVHCVFAGSNARVAGIQPGLERFQRKEILFNGVDWERKGGPDLATAFLKVLERHADARLTVLGCSPSLDLPNCEVLGRRPLEEVPEYFARASVFCLPTRIEPFGIAFVEALHHRLPIVATRIGALPDMVEDGRNGWLVKPGDVAALAEALCRLLDSPETCQRFGEAGCGLAQDRYTWEAVGKRLGAVMRASLQETPSS
jgi:glycosyltransferase involved in cell wall biosynthesis